jgi:hypothetical protein
MHVFSHPQSDKRLENVSLQAFGVAQQWAGRRTVVEARDALVANGAVLGASESGVTRISNSSLSKAVNEGRNGEQDG